MFTLLSKTFHNNQHVVHLKLGLTFLLLISSVLLISAPSLANGQQSSKIITAGGTITEIVFALGAGENVIAVDQSSQYPEQATKLPDVGYYRDLAAEGVLSFMPDTLLALQGTGRAKVIEQIKRTGVAVKIYNKPTSVDGLLQLIEELGEDLNRQHAASALQKQITTSLPAASPSTSIKAVFLLSAGDRGLIAAGADTVPQLLFDYNGIQNLADSHTGFKAINTETLVLLQPDFLVAPKHVVMGLGGKQRFCQSPALQLLTAAQQCRLLVMDSLLALGMTPRLAEAIAIINNWRDAK